MTPLPPYPGTTKPLSVNYVGGGAPFAIADDPEDDLDPRDLYLLAIAVEDHQHGVGRGLPVGRLTTATTPTGAGDVQIYGDDFRWWASDTDVLRTAVSLDADQTLTNKTLIDPIITSFVNAQHTHLDAAGAGALDGAAVATGTVGTGPLLRRDGAPLTGATLVDPVVRSTLFWGEVGGSESPITSLSMVSPRVLRGDFSLSLDGNVAYSHYLGDDGASWGAWGGTVPPTPFRIVVRTDGVDTERLLIGPTGTVTLAPAAGAFSLVWGGGAGRLSHTGITPVISSTAGANIHLDPTAGYVHPPVAGFHNIGHPSVPFAAFYSTAGTINPSTVEAKADIAPLDPAACAQAVLETDWVSFTYRPPVLRAPEPTAETAYDASDSNEVKAEKKAAREEAEAGAKAAYAKMLVETKPARDQKGYVLGSAAHATSDLYGLADRKSASPGSDLAVTSCALQWALQQLQALRAEVAALKAARP